MPSFLKNQRNFLIFSTLSVGIPCAVVFVWWLGKYVGISSSLLMVVIALGGGLLWGVLMWYFFVKGFLPSEHTGKKVNNKQR